MLYYIYIYIYITAYILCRLTYSYFGSTELNDITTNY